MIIYMIRNIETGEWLVSRNRRIAWTYKQHHGFISNSKSVIYGVMRTAGLDASIAEIVEFEVKEIK